MLALILSRASCARRPRACPPRACGTPRACGQGEPEGRPRPGPTVAGVCQEVEPQLAALRVVLVREAVACGAKGCARARMRVWWGGEWLRRSTTAAGAPPAPRPSGPPTPRPRPAFHPAPGPHGCASAWGSAALRGRAPRHPPSAGVSLKLSAMLEAVAACMVRMSNLPRNSLTLTCARGGRSGRPIGRLAQGPGHPTAQRRRQERLAAGLAPPAPFPPPSQSAVPDGTKGRGGGRQAARTGPARASGGGGRGGRWPRARRRTMRSNMVLNRSALVPEYQGTCIGRGGGRGRGELPWECRARRGAGSGPAPALAGSARLQAASPS
jgi:hypothetical protein